jgi:hypothetical protein
MRFILLIRTKQLNHIFLRFQGTKDKDLKASTTNVESVSNHKLFQLLLAAIALALKAHASSTLNADPRLMFSAKQHKKSASLFLKIPPQEEVTKLLALF